MLTIDTKPTEYTGLAGTIPFVWESRPGTPKKSVVPADSNADTPPIEKTPNPFLRRHSSLRYPPSNHRNDKNNPESLTADSSPLRRHSSLRLPSPSSQNDNNTPIILIRHPLPPPPSLQLGIPKNTNSSDDLFNRPITPAPSNSFRSPETPKYSKSLSFGPFLAKILGLKNFKTASPRTPTSLSKSKSMNSLRSLSSSSSTRLVSSRKKSNWGSFRKRSRFSSTPDSSFDSKREKGDESPTSTLCLFCR